MRPYLIVIWLLLPVAGAAYHWGPGQRELVLDDVSRMLEKADQAAAEEIWDEALNLYTEALAKLPTEQVATRRRVRLELAKVRMNASELPRARADLQTLVDELQQDKQADPALLASAREALANAKFYMTWLMRLEGVPRDEWEGEIESARELYRFLAEDAGRTGDQSATKRHRESLEAAVRLARMELKELQGLPLPSQ